MSLEVITEIDTLDEDGEPLTQNVRLTLKYVTPFFATFPAIKVEVPASTDPDALAVVTYIPLDQLLSAVTALQIQTTNPT